MPFTSILLGAAFLVVFVIGYALGRTNGYATGRLEAYEDVYDIENARGPYDE